MIIFKDAVQTSSSNSWVSTQSILLYVIVGAFVFYLLMTAIVIPILRKKKLDKDRAKRLELYDQLRRGQDVLLTSGIFGKIIKKKNDVFLIEIADGTQVKVQRDYILGFYKTKNRVANLKSEDFTDELLTEEEAKLKEQEELKKIELNSTENESNSNNSAQKSQQKKSKSITPDTKK